jgi:hypothetical protein
MAAASPTALPTSTGMLPAPVIGPAHAACWFASKSGDTAASAHDLTGVEGSTVLVEQLRSECSIALKACDYTLLKRLAAQLESMAFQQQQAAKAQREAAEAAAAAAPPADGTRAARASPRPVPTGVTTPAPKPGPATTIVDALVKKPVKVSRPKKSDHESLIAKALRQGRRPHHMVCKDCGLKGPSYGAPPSPGQAWKNTWCAGCAKANHPDAIRNPNDMAKKCVDCRKMHASCGPPGAADPEVTPDLRPLAKRLESQS